LRNQKEEKRIDPISSFAESIDKLQRSELLFWKFLSNLFLIKKKRNFIKRRKKES